MLQAGTAGHRLRAAPVQPTLGKQFKDIQGDREEEFSLGQRGTIYSFYRLFFFSVLILNVSICFGLEAPDAGRC